MKLCAFADEASSALSGQIAALKRNGISSLEIRGVNGKNIKDLSRDEVKEVKNILDGEGISVWSIGSPIGKISLADDFAAHFPNFFFFIPRSIIIKVNAQGGRKHQSR